jgi:hypothetical protein
VTAVDLLRCVRMRAILVSTLVLASCGEVGSRPADAAVTIDAVAGRATADRPDEALGRQVHTLYVVASDGVDRNLDTSGALATSVEAWSQWIARKTGGPRLRVDSFGGKPDITFIRLARTGAQLAAAGVRIRDELEADLTKLGAIDVAKLYAVYYDGDATTCGGSPLPPTLVGRVVGLYLDGKIPGAIPCRDNPFAASADTPGYFELSMIRGLLHAMGAVQICAPSHASGDVNDSPADIMYSGPQPWAPSEIDVGRDDYWGHTNTGCTDLARSAFLEPLPASPQLPPGW